MGDSIAVLDPVTVEGRSEPYLARVGFERRRKAAQGHFLDTTDVKSAGAVQFEEVFRMVPGVRLRPNGSSYLVELPSVETNQVWINLPLLMDLANISGGRYFDVNQVEQLAAAVPDRTISQVAPATPPQTRVASGRFASSTRFTMARAPQASPSSLTGSGCSASKTASA